MNTNLPHSGGASEVERDGSGTPDRGESTVTFEASTLDPSSATRAATSDGGPVGQVLGDYELLDKLGAGGMGIVYRARQRSANRIVALKLIRPERLADLEPAKRQQWLDRFQAEAQATARLEHEHIVTVYEVGSIDGVPFYSMRHVEGRTLADVVRDGPLENRRAAAVLEPVARAVDHAHRAGILHRDLKPRNILFDSSDRPFVMDFGLAKWLDRGSKGATQTGEIFGTPEYMSPEQANDSSRVTTASDVYSLGATLYDLLTGRPPFMAATPLDTLLQVLEKEPVAPRELNPAIDLDLETITLKCLAKEPPRRYATAADLADDLRRYLNGESIHARPVGITERTWRWSRRHPAAAGMIAAVVVGLLSVSSLSAALWNTNQRLVTSNEDLRLANKAETEAKIEAATKQEEAEQARDEAKQVLDYLVAAFHKSDPDADGETLTVAGLFGQAVEQLDTKFPNQPLFQAGLLDAIGQTYGGLGLHQKAVAVYERARDLRSNKLGEEHDATLRSINNLALAYTFAGRLAEALPILERTLELRKAKLGPDHPDTLSSMNNLAVAFESAGRLAEALPLKAKTLELMKAKLGPEHPSTLKSMNNLATAYATAGRFADALPLFEQTLELLRAKLGPEHSTTLGTMYNLAVAYESAGRLAEALPLFEKSLEFMKAKLGPEHPHTLQSMDALAKLYAHTERLAEALPLFREDAGTEGGQARP